FAPAGHLEQEAEKLPANSFDRSAACGDASGVDVDQVGPLLGQRCPRRYLDYRNEREPIGAALPRREHVQIHGRELLRPADEIAGRSGCKYQALGGHLLAVARDRTDCRAAGLRHTTQSLLHDVGEPATLVPWSRIRAAVGFAPREI